MNCQYYYQPVVPDNAPGNLRRAEDHETPEMFSVYFRGEDGLSEWVADFLIEADARKYVNDNNRKTVRIVVDVDGGCVQSIYGDKLPSDYQFEFVVRDWENIAGGDVDPLEGDTSPMEVFW